MEFFKDFLDSLVFASLILFICALVVLPGIGLGRVVFLVADRITTETSAIVLGTTTLVMVSMALATAVNLRSLQDFYKSFTER